MRTYLFIATLMGAWFLTVGSASAEIISAQLPYDQFGHLSNQGASCAATAVANSFRFLENRYPGIYDQRLTGDPNDPNSLAAARDRIRDGWQTGTNPPRPGMGCGPSPDVFWATKIQYIEDFAPGTTAFAGQFAATFFNLAAGTNFDINNFDQRGSIRDLPPTFDFLFNELLRGEDIEIAFQGTDVNGNPVDHAMTLTSLSFDDRNGNLMWDPATEPATIDYLDPNNPIQLFMSPLTLQRMNAGGMAFDFLIFNWNNGGANPPANGAFIYLGYAESPIPEPSTILLMGIGVVSLLGYSWRRQRARAKPVAL